MPQGVGMNSVVTNVAQSQLLNWFLIQPPELNSNDAVLLNSTGTLNIKPNPGSTIVQLLNASDITLNDFVLYDRSGAIFMYNSSSVLFDNTDTVSSISIDPKLLLSASLFRSNTSGLNPNQGQTDLDTFLENQIQQQTQIYTALGDKIQQQNQLNTVLNNQDKTNNTAPQTATTSAGANNIDLLTQETAAANIRGNTTTSSSTNNNNTTANTNATATANTAPQTTPTPAQIILTNAAQNAIPLNQGQNAMLLNAETTAAAASVLVGNATRTVIDTTVIAPTSSITPVTAISAPTPIGKIQANVDDNSRHSNQQREIAHTTTNSKTKSTTKATVRLMGAV